MDCIVHGVAMSHTRLNDFHSLQNNPESENIPQHAVISSRQSRHKRAPVWTALAKIFSQEGEDGRNGSLSRIWRCRNQRLWATGPKIAWAVGPEKEVSFLFPRPQALPGPRRRLAPVAAPAWATRLLSPWIWYPRWQRCTRRRVPLSGRCRSVSYWEIGRPLPAAVAQQKEFGGFPSLVQDLNYLTEAQGKCWISGLLVSLLMAMGRLCSIPHISPLSLGRLLFFLSFPKFI